MWQQWEKDLVEKGEVPEGRTYHQAAAYAHAHGIAWKELRKRRGWFWTPEELAMVAADQVPPGRTKSAIRFARRRHLEKK